MTSRLDHPASPAHRDWSRRPLPFALGWGLPIAVGLAAEAIGLSLAAQAFVWSAAFAWMGAACLMNARRCRRLHCFISGPALVIGAVVSALLGAGVLDLGPQGLQDTSLVVLLVTGLSFVPEIWRRYV